ncbi:hypothetical protein [Roseofilum casamattae]|uniref:Uncharacterized protein n=1 Tax=Roseofilum casamattae BLCC-M143 TaxID=3022442 RepID=A0ABT7C3A2_9CYAN|nr:hypothetical protein [Roseofilum casamattae]MDJ1185911.1 hypothetical protein [Roseofilum casamattae BLCC-M143]
MKAAECIEPDSPFLLWIPASLDDAGTQDFIHKQIAINNLVKTTVLSGVAFWEGMELLESSYSNIEIDEFIGQLDIAAKIGCLSESEGATSKLEDRLQKGHSP